MAYDLGETNYVESNRSELTEIGDSWRSLSLRSALSSFGSDSTLGDAEDELDKQTLSLWAQIDKLPISEQLKLSVFDDQQNEEKRVVDVTKLEAGEKHLFINKILKHIEHDNLRLLHKIKKRLDK
ncbi:hypothetical protein ACJIZ3_015879 [Penstemon smallii]|uniref:Uncharacterized protein n=1 Tax=Penstemon smallii TaxID=265156 RepID=A0ABD3RRM5_9LAMI